MNRADLTRPLRWFTVATTAYGALALASRTLVQRRETVGLDETVTSGTVTFVDGIRLHFVRAGSGPPALLLHGFGASTFSFRETVPALSPRFQATALDLPGFGYSDRSPEHDYSSASQAELVARFMRDQGMAGALVVGHSMGGGIALRLAQRHPELVSRLVLVGSMNPRQRLMPAPLVKLTRPLMPLLGLGSGLSHLFSRRAMRRTVHDPAFATPAVVAGYNRPSLVKGTHAALQRIVQDGAKDKPIDLSTIQIPTLLLWGESDRLVPLSVGRQLLEEIPDARLEVLTEAGHLPLEERPAAANAILLHWLEETENAAPDGSARI
ncbi:MAG TPA: alpha/beta hydrolase [Dehalococcoidia bacterium]|nr:alpha/beta hydrolase [Dehalococcoidia bacterium]